MSFVSFHLRLVQIAGVNAYLRYNSNLSELSDLKDYMLLIVFQVNNAIYYFVWNSVVGLTE